MSNIPQLSVRSVPLVFSPNLPDLFRCISRSSLVWKHGDSFLLGFGTAARCEIVIPATHTDDVDCTDDVHDINENFCPDDAVYTDDAVCSDAISSDRDAAAMTDGNIADAADTHVSSNSETGKQKNFSCHTPHRFHVAKDWWNQLRMNAEIDDSVQRPGSGLIAFGSFSFNAQSPAGSALIVPQLLLAADQENVWLTQICPVGAEMPQIPVTQEALQKLIFMISGKNTPAGNVSEQPKKCSSAEAYETNPSISHQTGHRQAVFTSLPEPEKWMQSVADATELIRRGELEKVVLSRCIKVQLPHLVSSAALLKELARAYPSTWVFSIDGLIGASPEMLAESDLAQSDPHRIHCRVLAGTKPFNTAHGLTDSTLDAAQSAQIQDFALETSAKNIHEHHIAADSAATTLNEFGTVEMSEPYVLDLPNVQHLATDLFTNIEHGYSLLDVIGKLHPTAALGGSPRRRALQTIARLEDTDRERYGAPVGWIASGTAGEFGQWAIALRCCEIAPNLRTVKAWAGSGIMAESVPSEELAETSAKFAPIMDALKSQCC